MKQKDNIFSLRKYIVIGYVLIALLTGGILYIYLQEWKQMDRMEEETRQIHRLRQNVHDAYAQMLNLTLYGETILEWEEQDTVTYKAKRMVMDSLLCGFSQYYLPARIDSVRRMLAEKEKQLFNIWELYGKQEKLNERIATQVPIIAYKSTQEPPKKKGGIFGIFKKKKKQQQTTTSTMLYTLNRDVVKQQQARSRELAEYADTLANRNAILNMQLQGMIRELDIRVQNDLAQRELTLNESREKGYKLIGSATGLMLLLLFMSCIIIHRDTLRIGRYKKQSDRLIREQKRTLQENHELLEARQKMMFTITHELRTPLSAITGYADLLGNDTDTEKREEYTATIRQSSERMASQLNMLLSFFRLDCGKEEINLAPFRLGDIVRTLEAEFRPQMEAKGLLLKVDECEDHIVMSDKERVIQIGGNLLSNALKFTKHGFVRLETSYNKGMFRMTVEDTGTGISDEEQKRIFKSFERLSNAATQDGFGLGLSIVDNLVRMLGGSIELDSQKGKGSRFTVRIPMPVAEDSVTVKETRTDNYPKRSFKVAVLDNDTVLLKMTKEIFNKYEIPCDTCTTAGELMERIRTKRYDLLITDLKMPEMDGYDVLALLRNSNVGNSKTIPVIVATAQGSCNETDLLEKGFDGCLFKPFSPQELIAVSERCVAEHLHTDEQPDFTSLLAYGDKEEMLDKLITATEHEMQGVKTSCEKRDREELREWVHHLRSSWAIIRADKPLRTLHELLHRQAECSEEELQAAVREVLEKGNEIIRLAITMKEELRNG